MIKAPYGEKRAWKLTTGFIPYKQWEHATPAERSKYNCALDIVLKKDIEDGTQRNG